MSFVETPIFMYNLRSRSNDKSKNPNNQRDALKTSKFKIRSISRSNDMDFDYPFQKLAANKIFILKKIEEFTFEKSDDSKDNLSTIQNKKSNSL